MSSFSRSGVVAVLVLLAIPTTGLGATRTHLGERPLRAGATGHDVRELQQLLQRAGATTRVDGRFGPGTTRAVRRFERDQRREVDGVVSRRDAAVLRDVTTNGSALLATGGTSPGPEPSSEPPQQTPAAGPLRGPGTRATLTPDGLAVAPEGAPPAVQQVIDAGNQIARKPYIYGGGHGKWEDAGYDCSGSVSYALHGAGLLERSMPSGGFMSWAEAGPGKWITTYSTPGHMYMVVAGLRFDTSGRSGTGSRWQTRMRSTQGYAVRHPAGL